MFRGWRAPPPSSKVANPRQNPLATKLEQWLDDWVRFKNLTRDAELEASPYRTWFNCGRWLGECESHLVRKQPHRESDVRDARRSVQYLQQSVAELPQPFLDTFYWLEHFRDFDFQTESPTDWAKTVPPRDGYELQPVKRYTRDGSGVSVEDLDEDYKPHWAARHSGGGPL